MELVYHNFLGRDKKKVATTFHGAGMVVPYDKNSEVGYREIPETTASLKKIFNKIIESQNEENEDVKNKAFDALQGTYDISYTNVDVNLRFFLSLELVTNVQFANDEGDPGMGLELGINLLVYGGNCLNSTARHLLTVGYTLMDREAFTKIVNAHLNRRRETQACFKAE